MSSHCVSIAVILASLTILAAPRAQAESSNTYRGSFTPVPPLPSTRAVTCLSGCLHPNTLGVENYHAAGISSSVCIVDQSLIGACPVCIGDRTESGRCEGFCVHNCTTSLSIHRRGFGDIWDVITEPFENVGNAFNDVVDNFNNFFDDVSNTVQNVIVEQLKRLPEHIQNVIDSAQGLTQLALSELDRLGQDILGHLKDVATLTLKQVTHLANRLVSFTTENLRGFLEKLDEAVWQPLSKILGCIKEWDPAQLAVLAARAVTSFGPLKGWDVDLLIEIGDIVKGMAAGDFSEVDTAIFKSAVFIFSGVTGLDADKVEVVAGKAVEAFGIVSDWDKEDWRSINDLARGIATGDLEQVSPEALATLGQVVGFDQDRVTAISTRVLTLVDDLKDNNNGDGSPLWQDLARFAAGLSADDIIARDLPPEAISLISRAAETPSSLLPTLMQLMRDKLGPVKDWTRQDWQQLGHAAAELTGMEIGSMNMDGLRLLSHLENLPSDKMLVAAARAQELLGPIDSWKQEDVKEVGNLVKALSGVDFKRMGEDALQTVLSTALDFEPDQLQGIFDRLQEIRGNVTGWTPEQLSGIQHYLSQLNSLTDAQTLGPVLLAMAQRSDLGGVLTTEQIESVVDAAVEAYGEMSTWDADTWSKLSTLGSDVVEVLVSQITADQIEAIRDGVKDWTPAGLQKLGERVTQLLGAPSQFSLDDWKKLGHLARGLRASDLSDIKKDGVEFFGALLRETASNLCDNVNSMAVDCGSDMRIRLSSFQLCGDQVQAILFSAKTQLGDVTSWTSQTVNLLGPLIGNLAGGDFALLQDDTVANMVELGCLVKNIVQCAAERIGESGAAAASTTTTTTTTTTTALVNAGSLAGFSRTDFERVGQALVGFTQYQLSTMRADGFEEVVELFSKLDGWELPQLRRLADKAKDAFGEPSKWKSTTVVKLQEIVAGLDRTDLTQVKPSGFSSMDPSVYNTFCKTRTLSWLTPQQLKKLPEPPLGFKCEEETTLFTFDQVQASKAVSAMDAGFASSSSGSDGLSDGAVAGVVIAVLLALAIIAVLVVMFLRKSPMSGMKKPTRHGTSPEDATALRTVSVTNVRKQFEQGSGNKPGAKRKAPPPPPPKILPFNEDGSATEA